MKSRFPMPNYVLILLGILLFTNCEKPAGVTEEETGWEHGERWEQTGGPPRGTVSTIVFDTTTGSLFAESGGLLFGSPDDGVTWFVLGLDHQVSFIDIGPTGDLYAGGTDYYVLRSSDQGETWIDLLFPEADHYQGNSEYPTRASHVAVTPSGVILVVISIFNNSGERWANNYSRSMDDGASWTSANPPKGGGDPFVFDLKASPSGAVFVSRHDCLSFSGECYDNFVFRLMEDSETWESVLVRSRDTPAVNGFLINADGDILASMNRGLLRSNDNGTTWIDLRKGYQFLTMGVNLQGEIFASTYDKRLIRSPNNGDTWIEVSTNLGDTYIYDFAFRGDEEIFAGTSRGLLHSTDGGVTWLEINHNQPP